MPEIGDLLIVKKRKTKKSIETKKEEASKYKKERWRRLLFDKIKKYVEEHTEDDIDEVFDKSDDVAKLRKTFKMNYGSEDYFKYISPQQSEMYERMRHYAKKYKKENIEDHIDPNDERWQIRKKFMFMYGNEAYFKHIAIDYNKK
jgi:hypothetical protein